MSREQELMLRLAATSARRAENCDRIRALCQSVDYDRLARELDRQGLLPLLGGRAVEAAHGVAPATFARTVSDATAHSRRRATLFARTAHDLCTRLEDAGLPVLQLKGDALAERIHGDVGLRAASDIDLLVAAADLDRAIAVLATAGYEQRVQPNTSPLHRVLEHSGRVLPPVELHWRVHWYESEFSPRVLAHSSRDAAGPRTAAPADDLAMLVLFYARDGFAGLRYVADATAWWDRFGESIGHGALRRIGTLYPALERPLVTGTALLDRLAGVPAATLLDGDARLDRRESLALRLANWSLAGDRDQMAANKALVDLLLAPPRGGRAFVRRSLSLSGSDSVSWPTAARSGGRERIAREAHFLKLIGRCALARSRMGARRSWTPVDVY